YWACKLHLPRLMAGFVRRSACYPDVTRGAAGGGRLEPSLRAARACALLLAGLGGACGRSGKTARVADPPQAPVAAHASAVPADPAPGLIAESEAHLKAGLA